MSRAAANPLFVAWFDDAEALLEATGAARAAGFSIADAYTPYPVHGMDEAMGLRPSRLTWVCFCAGVAGLAFALWLQTWTSAVSWPLNVGGKPPASLPAFVPVIFELTVLFAGLTTVAALFLRANLRPRLRPTVALARVTNDRFALAIATRDSHFDVGEVRTLCQRCGAVETALWEGP